MGYVKIPEATNRAVDFTSSGTWTCPAGVYSARFLVVGAGGAGGGTGQLISDYAMGGGGGGGSVKEITLTTTPATSYTITIGAKGTGVSAAAGGAGGFSEVLNGATSLIKSFGGCGANGITASAEVIATVASTFAGGPGAANIGAANYVAGGGGGSNPVNSGHLAQWQVKGTFGEGSPGRAAATTSTIGGITATGGAGVNGYGAGGGGGVTFTAPLAVTGQGGSSFAGNGASRSTAGVATGGAAIANTGCGGGGSVAYLSATSTTGGNGADGLVRITYFA